MISIAHAVTGAYIASVLPNPVLYVPLCIASHFALDYVAHYDIGVAARCHHFSRKKMALWEALDLIGAFALVAILWHQTPTSFSPDLWLGAFTGILPDLIEATNYFFHRPSPIFQPFYYFHQRFHHSTTDIFWGTLPQIILVSVIVLLVITN